jgi:hypothetical protein
LKKEQKTEFGSYTKTPSQYVHVIYRSQLQYEMGRFIGCNVGVRKQETFLSHNNNNNNNNNNVPVAAKRRPQNKHKITHSKPNITQQIHYKYTT